MLRTDGGDCEITFAGYKASEPVTTAYFINVGDFVELVAAYVGSTLTWIVVAST